MTAAAGDARVSDVRVPLPPWTLRGRVCLPAQARGLVIVAQGSALSRPGTEAARLARALEGTRIGTAWFDLLMPGEGQSDERTRLTSADVQLLAGRLVVATDWLAQRDPTRGLAVIYFGVGAHASVAFLAASERPSGVAAVVSWDGTLEEARPAVANVTVPTLSLATDAAVGVPGVRTVEVAREWLVAILAASGRARR
jgi:putative phosphoribosyl transferase